MITLFWGGSDRAGRPAGDFHRHDHAAGIAGGRARRLDYGSRSGGALNTVGNFATPGIGPPFGPSLISTALTQPAPCGVLMCTHLKLYCPPISTSSPPHCAKARYGPARAEAR